MIKLFGKNNDLRTEEGVVTKTGYMVMAVSSIFGFCVFLFGRHLYGAAMQKRQDAKQQI